MAEILLPFKRSGFANDCLLIPGHTTGMPDMSLSHGPHFDRPRSGVGQATPLRHLMHRHGRNILDGLVVAVMLFAAALSVMTS
jgi:hypothetical protein